MYLVHTLSAPAATICCMTDSTAAELDKLEREILDFEQQWWKYAGAKVSAVRERFDMSATRYYQVLNALLDQPAALAYSPLLVRRLRRLREARQRQRSARRYSTGGAALR